ncbi:hypothetical protein B0H11DRAFT_1922973 [Mycena galericulata]|nr:hypothetical protein B0H11DRAFT_1922973 [Mycena galericulata]
MRKILTVYRDEPSSNPGEGRLFVLSGSGIRQYNRTRGYEGENEGGKKVQSTHGVSSGMGPSMPTCGGEGVLGSCGSSKFTGRIGALHGEYFCRSPKCRMQGMSAASGWSDETLSGVKGIHMRRMRDKQPKPPSQSA